MAKPCILLYAPAGSDWAGALKRHCAIQGLRLRVVEPSDLGRSLSSLAQGGGGESTFVSPVPEPLLVFCSLSDAQLDRLLSALRRMGVPRGVMKAVLTPSNAGWSFSALYGELCRERMAVEGR